MRLTKKNFSLIGVHWKIQFLVGEGHEKTKYKGEFPEKEGFDSFQI